MIPEMVAPVLLDRYLAGECSSEELSRVHTLLDTDPTFRVMLDQMHDIRSAAGEKSWETDRMWRRLDREIQNRQTREKRAPDMGWRVGGDAGRGVWREKGERGNGAARLGGGFQTQPLRRSIWYSAAAGVVGVLCIIFGWRGDIHQRAEPTLRPISTYATANGERASITLLDGTTVALGVASRVDVPSDFATNHIVYLTGEGLFTVSHHAGAPFTVVAGATSAHVLGTSFVVRHYPSDTNTTVAVSTGKVVVGSTVVSAQQFVEVRRHTVPEIHHADPSMFSFATGVLVMNVTPLSDAIPELDRWFDVDIRLGDPVLAKERIAGRFTTGSLAELTQLFEMAYDVRVVRTGRVITLFPRR